MVDGWGSSVWGWGKSDSGGGETPISKCYATTGSSVLLVARGLLESALMVTAPMPLFGCACLIVLTAAHSRHSC